MMTYEKEIENSHPTMVDSDAAYDADSMAMKLVGERHSKRDLVNLVRWLIMDGANTVSRDINVAAFGLLIKNNNIPEQQGEQ
jgi:hypothetical protein